MAVAFAQSVGIFAVVVEGELEAGLGVAGDGKESVGGIVTDGGLAGELETELVGVEVEATVEVENPVAGVYVLHETLLFPGRFAVYFNFLPSIRPVSGT
jgi:hypothetical protein